MKYLLEDDYVRLVTAAERYEAAAAIIEQRLHLSRSEIDKLVDSELSRQADDSQRASGDSECKVCSKTYRQHPRGGPIGWGGEQFLNRLCGGRLVKL